MNIILNINFLWEQVLSYFLICYIFIGIRNYVIEGKIEHAVKDLYKNAPKILANNDREIYIEL